MGITQVTQETVLAASTNVKNHSKEFNIKVKLGIL